MIIFIKDIMQGLKIWLIFVIQFFCASNFFLLKNII